MEILIPVNYDSEQPTVSARDLHEGLEINTDFRKWFPRMTEYGFTENVDWKRVYQKCPPLAEPRTWLIIKFRQTWQNRFA